MLWHYFLRLSTLACFFSKDVLLYHKLQEVIHVAKDDGSGAVFVGAHFGRDSGSASAYSLAAAVDEPLFLFPDNGCQGAEESGQFRSYQFRKGSGAFVRPELYSEIKSLVIIGDNRENSPMFPFSEMLFSLDTGDLPVRWVSNDFAMGNANDYFQPGQAILWLLPSENQVLLMRHLKQKGLPQLLINRSYEDFDYICTEVRESLEEGLTWLLQESGPELAFLSKLPGSFSLFE